MPSRWPTSGCHRISGAIAGRVGASKDALYDTDAAEFDSRNDALWKVRGIGRSYSFRFCEITCFSSEAAGQRVFGYSEFLVFRKNSWPLNSLSHICEFAEARA